MNPMLALDLKRTAAKFLQTIPDGLPLDETLQRLRSADRYASLLASPKIQFEPWNAVAEAKQILRQIEALRDYRKGSPEPKLDNPDLCNWIPQCLPGNKDLMILLICCNPSHQKKLIPVLAAKGEGVTEEECCTIPAAPGSASARVPEATPLYIGVWQWMRSRRRCLHFLHRLNPYRRKRTLSRTFYAPLYWFCLLWQRLFPRL